MTRLIVQPGAPLPVFSSLRPCRKSCTGPNLELRIHFLVNFPRERNLSDSVIVISEILITESRFPVRYSSSSSPMGMPGGASMGLAGVNFAGSRWNSWMRSMRAARWMASAVSVSGGAVVISL